MPRGNNTEKKILKLLQEDNRITNREIAEKVGVNQSAITKAIDRINAKGLISAGKAVLNHQKLGVTSLSYIYVRLKNQSEAEVAETANWIKTFKNVQEIHAISGDFHFLIKVRFANDTKPMDFINHIQRQGNCDKTETIFVMDTLLETSDVSVCV